MGRAAHVAGVLGSLPDRLLPPVPRGGADGGVRRGRRPAEPARRRDAAPLQQPLHAHVRRRRPQQGPSRLACLSTCLSLCPSIHPLCVCGCSGLACRSTCLRPCVRSYVRPSILHVPVCYASGLPVHHFSVRPSVLHVPVVVL